VLVEFPGTIILLVIFTDDLPGELVGLDVYAEIGVD
jgi:hypothetical protein